ncbi:MAG: PLuB system helicase-like protein, partial [Persicimonas sp.]
MFSTFSPPENLAETEPLYRAPTGPVWRLSGSEILEGDSSVEQEFLVRKLGLARSMLHVAPLLEQVTRFDHPRMWGPSYWRRIEDAVWVATPAPRGELLSKASLERLSFAEALELWRPLAEAVARLHRKGMVHGQIAAWNVWVDEAAGKLTATDAGCWIADDFSSLDVDESPWLAPEMRGAAHERDPGPAADVYGLARLLLFLTLPREQALKARPNLQGIPGYAIPSLEAALSERPSQRPGRVSELIGAMAPRSLHDEELPDVEAETTSFLHARVSGIERLEHPKFGEGIKFFLHRQDSASAGAQSSGAPPTEAIGAFFYEKQAPDVFNSVKWVWDGCELNLLDARVVENSQGERFLTSNDRTLPVLEPHMPMSVSAVLEAEGCPSRFLVDQRDRGGSSRPLVFGNLVHGLLDDLVEPEPPSFEDAFGARIQDLRLDLLAAGLADSDLAKLEKDARQHFENMRRFTEGRTDESAEHDRVGWSGRNVEVTRYSTRYGIEGRIDLVAEDPKEGLQIVELKSGSTWDGHLSQLRFYRFLWNGLAKARGLEVTGHIMYSRQGTMKPAPMEDTERERRILRARNELIACLRSFVAPDYEYEKPYYMLAPRTCRAPSCNFRRDRCSAQTEVLGLADGMSPWEAVDTKTWDGFDPDMVARGWAWHEHFGRLIEMERWASTAELGKVLHADRLEERRANYAASGLMKLAVTRPRSSYVDFSGDHGRLFSAGDYLLAHQGDFNTAHILRGRVVSVDGDTVTIRSPGAPIASELGSDGWILDKLPARLGFRQAHHALYGALELRDEDRLEVLLRPETKRARSLASAAKLADDPDIDGSRLNRSQQEALRLGLSAPQAALIQGPPGTGKTTVIAHLVKELVARGERVLVSAFTNTAVDTILTNLLEVGVDDFLRVGYASRSPDLVRTLEAGEHSADQYFTGDLAAKTESLDDLSKVLLSRSVIASTTHRCVSSPVMEFFRDEIDKVPFSVAIVDEAAQITEPMTLAATNLAERFVLVGDHKQLPPIVENEQAHSNFVAGLDPQSLDSGRVIREDDVPLPEAAAAPMDTGHSSSLPPELAEMGCAGLDRSLFERLVERLPHVMLDEQYRMHADIMAFSNQNFYGGGLTAHESVRDHTLALDAEQLTADASIAEILAPAKPLVFVDVDHDAHARHNQEEAEALVATLEALLTAD